MSHVEATSGGTKLGRLLIESATVAGPASYATGGFTITCTTLTTLHRIFLQRADVGAVVPLEWEVTVATNIATVKALVATTGVEVAPTTNLSTVQLSYLAVGV